MAGSKRAAKEYKNLVLEVRIKVKRGMNSRRELREVISDYVVDAIMTMKGAYRPPGALNKDDPGHFIFDNIANVRVHVRMPRS